MVKSFLLVVKNIKLGDEASNSLVGETSIFLSYLARIEDYTASKFNL